MSEDLPEHEWRTIADYVEGQSNKGIVEDEERTEVTLVQRVRSYRLLGSDYEIFDVHTNLDERWWVITNPTNLYLQGRFPSYDETFSFHLGLGLRIMNQERVETDDDRLEHIGGAWRRYDDAVNALNTAREAEDFQSIGIKCRDALIAFGKQHQADEWVIEDGERPKANDFKQWADLYAKSLATGRVRRYLKEISHKTWDIAVELQHYSNATSWDAELVLDATHNVFDGLSTAMVKRARKEPDRCPNCGSYRFSLTGHVDVRSGTRGWLSFEACSACSYRSEESFDPWDD
ncbi:hypothetical protein BI49514_02333 [Brevibacterium iodinum ATCC 49514]|uniref:Uncharacterized protein n=1 Tax=Brevibacterium iodinum ATCC 49514 TaxID=1255616 RepID=A0A2H1JTY1_9MICO|nr:hypothetical protein [Brevibacterium iodinum]SMX90738.1 hypothetical protein BI49514_02333 [Brevibacterium iodinum ATCC 49514]SUW12424.1 Uncharacterised protein [Brevibacterium iodinum]